MEDTPLDNWVGINQGYVHSKWVSEKLLFRACERGLPVSIHRPGLIGGHSQTGVTNTNDFIWAMVKGCIQLGLVPDTFEGWILTPVDTITEVLLYITGQPEWMNKNFHYMPRKSIPWPNIIGWMQAYGYKLDTLPLNSWVDALFKRAEKEDNALCPFLPMFADSRTTAEYQRQPESIVYNNIDCKNFEMALAKLSKSNPLMGQSIFETYLEYLVVGFLLVR